LLIEYKKYGSLSFVLIKLRTIPAYLKVLVTLYLYIICSILVPYFTLDIVLSSWLASVSFFVLPFLTGFMILDIIEKMAKFQFNDLVLKSILALFVGFFGIFFFTCLLVNSPIWNTHFFAIILLVSNGFWLLVKIKNARFISDRKIWIEKKKILIGIITFIVLTLSSVIVTLTETNFLPFPLLYDPGTPSYIYLTLQFYEGNGISFWIILERLHLIFLLGFSCSLYSLHPVFLNYTVAKLFPLLLTFFTFLLCKEITSSTPASILASLLVPWVYIRPLSTDLTPTTLLFVLFPLALLLIYRLSYTLESYRIKLRKILIIVFMELSLLAISLFQFLFLPNSLTAKVILIATTLSLVVGILLIRDIYTKKVVLVCSALTLFIMYTHLQNSLFYVPILFAVFFIGMLLQKNPSRAKMIYLFAVFVVYAFIVLQVTGLLVFNNNFLITSHFWGNLYDHAWFNMDANQKLTWLTKSASTYYVLLISFLSLPFALTCPKLIPIAMAYVLSIFLLFFPEGHFWRLYTLFNVPSAILISSIFILLPTILLFDKVIIYKTKHHITFKINKLKTFKYITKSKLLILTILIIIVFSMFVTITTPLVDKKLTFVTNTVEYINRHGTFSYITTDELSCAMFIYYSTPKEWVPLDYFSGQPLTMKYDVVTLHAPKLTYTKIIPRTEDTLIISDPYTMFIMSGISGRDVAIDEKAFIDEQEYAIETLQQMDFIKTQIFMANSSSEAYNSILDIRRDHRVVLIVISGRTFEWINSDKRFVKSFKPVDIDTFMKNFTIFQDKEYFTPFYQYGNIIIFKVNIG